MITVVNLKGLSKYIAIAIILVVFMFFANKLMVSETGNKDIKMILSEHVRNVPKESLEEYMKTTIPMLGYAEEEDVEQFEIHLSVKEILKFELGMLNNIIEESELEINEEELTDDDLDELIDKQAVETEVIETKVKESYSDEYNDVRIKNSSKYDLTDEMLTPDFELTNKKDILIYHTHTCESYTPTEENNYKSSGNYRSTDLNYTVARVGDELEKYLTKLNYNVIHDKTYHDFPAYSGSYDRSYETVSKLVEEHPGVEVAFDIHRDAVGSDGSYAPTVKIGDEYVAQLMFVIGTNGGGLEHPNWQNNLKVAIKIQQVAEKLYPGLFRPIVVRDSRYNQNLANGASIIEVGATGNTLEQCMGSMKYLSIVLSEVMK